MTAHDFDHLCWVRRPAGRAVDHLGSLAEISRTYRGWRDQAERPRILPPIVIEYDLRPDSSWKRTAPGAMGYP
jgi:hypothetical protein